MLVKNSHKPPILIVNPHEKEHLCLSAGKIQSSVMELVTGRGTWCYGLLDMVVFGQQLDLMIFEVFSNLIDTVKFV